MFTFSPLLGAQSSSPASQSLLELDGDVKILIDVGWDESFNATKLQELEKQVSTLSIVLLTHATIEHVGAYAHCCKHVPGFSRIPCYATTPVVNLGKTTLLDLYASNAAAASIVPKDGMYASPVSATSGEAPNLLLQAPTADEIASYFALINPLKYSQPHQPIPSPFSPPLAGLTVTAYSAGHTLGGTIWHIQHGLESIVYASDWNLGRENFFPGAAWLKSGDGGEVLEALHRPTALVCSSRGVERPEALARKDRDARILSLIRETIAQGGKVLIPTDTSARVLELAFILNSTWRENIDGPHADTYRNARIYMASKSSTATARYLQSMLEWMDDSVIRNAEAAMTRGDGRGGAVDPLKWNFVRQIERKSQLERVVARNRPCVLLTSDTSLEWGFSGEALQSLAADSRNLVILTERISEVERGREGLGRQLWDFYQTAKGHESAQSGAKVVSADEKTMDIREKRTESLSAEENRLYQQYLARQRQIHSNLQGDNTLDENTTAEIGDEQVSESSDESDEDEDVEHQGRAFNVSAQLTQNKRKIGLTDAELGVNVLLQSKNVHDYDVRNKRGREKMFPFVAHRNKDDEFGEVIKPEDYLRAEERDEIEGVDLRNGNTSAGQDGAAVGQKRKWDESATGRQKNRREKVQTKRAKVEPRREPDDIDAIIARATGEAGAGGASAVAAGDGDDSSESEESDYEPEDSTPEGPQKLVYTTKKLRLNLKIAYVDFAGLYRLTDLQGLIGRINPRKLIVTAGDASETKLLADTCKAAENGSAVGEIFTPVLGETVDASVDTNAWTVKLTRQLVKRLNWKELGTDKPSIAAITGMLGSELPEIEVKEEDEEGAKKKLKLSKSQQPRPSKTTAEEAMMPLLNLLNTQSTAQQRAAQPVHVGDLRLAEIRAAVQAQGHTAEFRGGGTLLVDGTVIVRKSQTTGGIEVEAGGAGLSMPGWRTTTKDGRLETEGTFFAVKQAIYDRLAVVAGA